MKTLTELRDNVRYRMGDLAAAIWSDDEIDLHLSAAYDDIAEECRVFWDIVYLENLPHGFSYTQPWEKAFLSELSPGFDYGCANYTAAVDYRALGDDRDRIGPGNHTSPFEIFDGWLDAVHADPSIPATAEVPNTLTSLNRVTWDNRMIDAMNARKLAAVDSRYEITKGEVYGFIWEKDGIRTLRKVRVPSARSDQYVVDGSWGILRDLEDLDAGDTDGTWGCPRRIPGHHPIGPFQFGLPRRVYREGKNVRVEHFRYGTDLEAEGCELPDIYALYLRDYTQYKLFERPGPGQDLQLAAHFKGRWARDLARIQKRTRDVDTERVVVFGDGGPSSVLRPPRPKLPWPYGERVKV